MGTASVVGTGPGRFGNSGRGRVEGQSERQAGSNIFPWCSRGQTSSFSPPAPGGRDVISSISIPSPAGRSAVAPARGESVGAAAASASRQHPAPHGGLGSGTKPRPPQRVTVSSPVSPARRRPGDADTPRAAGIEVGGGQLGDAGSASVAFERQQAAACWGLGTPGLDPAPTSLLAQPEGQKRRQPNLGFWESATPSAFPSPSLDAQR